MQLQLQLVHHKLIGVLHFNAVRSQNSFRKILDVERNDGSGYDMPVIRVW